ncbi:hypothetical protein GIB67_018532 [Kingdonia uniflora]|uniref:Uncharacterized protein n=1 Tax=Kingdonia uniflora TaxID=39325 RepID=A0A7J7LWC1_9MAGN|nr:hypothetical protein GIB67_018532 [Kingdonia uniflora]
MEMYFMFGQSIIVTVEPQARKPQTPSRFGLAMNKHKQRNTQHQDYSDSENYLRPLSRERESLFKVPIIITQAQVWISHSRNPPNVLNKGLPKGFRSNDIRSCSNEKCLWAKILGDLTLVIRMTWTPRTKF